jgi:putative ABC transport system substrate-binding protein
MRRREFIALVGGAAAWSIPARAQQPVRPVIGFLSSRSSSDSAYLVAAFRRGLSENAFVEQQNVDVEYRWAEGRYDRLPALAVELVRRPVAVLVAVGGEPSALAAKAATSTIPIVFTTGGDPVKIGLVPSLSRPDGNATGISLLTTAPEGKRLGLLHELAPSATAIGALINPNYQEADAQSRELQAAALVLKLQLHIARAKNEAELELAFATFVQKGINALILGADPFFDTKRDRIVAWAAERRLPAVYQFREYAVAGGLASYGISITDGYRQVGGYVGQILKGAKPADLPVVQSLKFELVINLNTAKTLGLILPPIVFAQADEVIE